MAGTTGIAEGGMVDLRTEVTVFDRFRPYADGCWDSEREAAIAKDTDHVQGPTEL